MSLATLPSRALASAAALAAIVGLAASPVAAASLKVNVAGVDAKTAHVRVVKAAEAVCSSVLANEPLSYYLMPSCIDETVAATEAKFAANERRLASLQPTGR